MDDGRAQELVESLSVGQVVSGDVLQVRDFGVFVDLGGVHGLLLIPEISWDIVSHPKDYFAVGDVIETIVLATSLEHLTVSLGYKQFEPDPWGDVQQRFPIGERAHGHIDAIMEFGVFVTLAPCIKGLAHRDAFGERWDDVTKTYRVGDAIRIEIMEIDLHDRKICLEPVDD